MFYAMVAFQIIGIILTVFALGLLLNGDSTHAQKLMVFFIFAELIQNSAMLAEMFARSVPEALLAIKAEYLGGTYIGFFYMLFIYYYCRRDINQLFCKILFAIDTCIYILLVTNELHNLYYRSVEFVDTGAFPHLELTYGPAFYLFVFFCIATPHFISVSTIVSSIFKEVRKTRRKNLFIVLAGLAVPIVSLVLYLVGVFPPGYDPTSLLLTIPLSILVMFVWNKNDIDLVKVGASTMIDSIGACIITLDENKKIIRYNVRALQLFPDIDEGKDIFSSTVITEGFFDGREKDEFTLANKRYEAHLRQLNDTNMEICGYTILITDITESYEHILEINALRETAEKSNRAKSDFLANMSHEIRTPMNIIVGMCDLVVEESVGRKAYNYAITIKNAANNLLCIINDILDISKVESGKMEFVESDYSIEGLMLNIEDMMNIAAVQRGLKLECTINSHLPATLLGDEGRIRQIIINIINNAIKFTQEGFVKVGATGEYIDSQTLMLKFTIQDSGIGIKEEDLAKIYNSFQQLDMKRNRKTEGSGLGLAISKNFVDLMGGTIDVQSVYGEGTTFTICIPQTILDHTTIANAPFKKNKDTLDNYKPFIAPDYRILIVDDNSINRQVAIGLLTDFNFIIEEASSGAEAIEKVKQTMYDLIFMDHMMPEMDGVQTTRIIREQCGANGTEPLIIALTANALAGAREMFLRNGFNEFISKPIVKDRLYAMLSRYVSEDRKTYVEPVDKTPVWLRNKREH